jgi:general secretion pathway protein M
MNWRVWWARMSARERGLIAAAGAVLGLLVLRFIVLSPFLAYRESLREEIASHREMLDNDQAYLARAGEVTKNLELLRARLAEIRTQLVPGDTPTLAAANLQDVLHSLAAEKGINIQSTQVMREDTVGEFRRIAVRITVTGELHPLADFLSAVEYGPRRVTLPYVEVSRRGAVLRGQSARSLAATIEVSAFLQGADNQAKPEMAAGAGEAPAEAAPPDGAAPSASAAPPTPAGPAAGTTAGTPGTPTLPSPEARA